MAVSGTQTVHSRLLADAQARLQVSERALFMKAAARAFPDATEYKRSEKVSFDVENFRKEGMAPRYVEDFAIDVMAGRVE
jgi:hypothetical protein